MKTTPHLISSVMTAASDTWPAIDTPVPVQSIDPVDIPPMNTVIYFRELADGPGSRWRLGSVLYMSEVWTIVRTLESANTEELSFESDEIEFATQTPAEELDEQIYNHMYDLLTSYSVRCLFEAGWRLVKEEGDNGIPF